MKIELFKQVSDFIRDLPPDPRHSIRLALRRLSFGKGDIKPLEAPLGGYCRLRVGTYRIIFRYDESAIIRVDFIERRSVVYELFEERMKLRLASLKSGRKN